MPLPSSTERLLVTFDGVASGCAPLTWGQQHMWQAINASGSPMNMCAIRPLSTGATVQEFVDELRYYLHRFESMRTLIRVPADGSLPTQEVLGSGEVWIEIVDATDPDAAATAIAKAQETTHFDVEHELPIRMMLVRHERARSRTSSPRSGISLPMARGGTIQLGCFFNDRPAQTPPPDRVITPVEIARATPGEASYTPMRTFHEGVMLNATTQSDAYHLEIRTNADFMSRDAATALIGVMEHLAVGAATAGALE